MDCDNLRAELKEYGQEHLLHHLEGLDDIQKASLYADIKNVDFKKLCKLWKEAQHSMTDNGTMKDSRLKPLDSSIVGSTAKDKKDVSRWSDMGERDGLVQPTSQAPYAIHIERLHIATSSPLPHGKVY